MKPIYDLIKLLMFDKQNSNKLDEFKYYIFNIITNDVQKNLWETFQIFGFIIEVWRCSLINKPNWAYSQCLTISGTCEVEVDTLITYDG